MYYNVIIFLIIYIFIFVFRYLVVNPKDRRVVIVESVLCPILFRNTLAEVLFLHFEVYIFLIFQCSKQIFVYFSNKFIFIFFCLLSIFFLFQIPSLVYVPSHLMALFTLGISTAMVMDVGYSETSVLPVSFNNYLKL